MREWKDLSRAERRLLVGGPLALSLAVAFLALATLLTSSALAGLLLLVVLLLLLVGGAFSIVGAHSAGRPGVRDPPSPWWVGAGGALGTGIGLVHLFTFSARTNLFFVNPWDHPLALPLLFALPAVVGYLLLAPGAETVPAEASAVGIALSWVLFMVLASSISVGPFLAILLLPFLAVLLMWAGQEISTRLATRYATRFANGREA